jgi:hypothetical protein
MSLIDAILSNMESSTAPRDTTDPVAGDVASMLARVADLAARPEPATRAGWIDRIAALERLKAAVAAAQNAQIIGFGRAEVEHHLAHVGVGALDPAAVGRGVADQIALACKISPAAGSRRLGVARALHADLPETAALLAAGDVSEYVAALVVSDTRHLDPQPTGCRPAAPPRWPRRPPTPPTPPGTSTAAAPPGRTGASGSAPHPTP